MAENQVILETLPKIQIHHHYDGQMKIPHLLTPTAPFESQVFIGREDDLEKLNQQLSAHNTLLLVNGEGGMGKTTLAAHYCREHSHEYNHLAWILAEPNISDVLITNLKSSLNLEFDPKSSAKEQLNQLFLALANLPPPCLLVIDNANSFDDLSANYGRLQQQGPEGAHGLRREQGQGRPISWLG